MKRFIWIILLLTAAVHGLQAQSVVGKWKTVSNVIENTDGKTNDLLAMQLKMWPCMAQVETIFDANGKQYNKSPEKCGPIDINKQTPSTWKMQGNELSITNTTVTTMLGSTATYTVECSGNKLILTHAYNDAERKKLHAPKAKKVIITYVKI